jgi:REP element-mobilizing transposase RayT
LNTFGQIVWDEWFQTAVVRPYVKLDEFVVMPNHVHGILFIDDSVGTWRRHVPTSEPRAFGKPVAGSLSTIIGSFKSVVTRRINELRNTLGASVWQGRYYDEIIRNEAMLNQIRQYILYNPARWAEDHENPVNVRG